jgi:FKBP-type peptidyl-prolyl cis-trans isomerase SlpA
MIQPPDQKAPQRITQGCRILLHFSLSLEDGTEILSTYEQDPLAFTLGDGTMEQTLEAKLIGLRSGDNQALILAGNDIYGPWDEANRQWIDADRLAQTLELSPGQVIAFTTADGDELAARVEAIEDHRVLLDFNHPLSGMTFIFDATVLEVESPE